MSALSVLASEENFLTLKEVAAFLRVCPRTIEREIAKKHFPQPLRIGRSLRFSEADVRAYIAKLKGTPASPSLT